MAAPAEISTFCRALWELYELNFCWDLRALDERVRRPEVLADQHTEHLENALATHGLFSFDSTHASSRLAASGPQDCLPAILSLRRLMQDWEGPLTPPILNSMGQDLTTSEIQSLETAVAQNICQTFFNFF